MNAQVIPIAEGGASGYTWETVAAMRNTYRIRRGHRPVATITLNDSLPFHSAIVTDVCALLASHERDEGA